MPSDFFANLKTVATSPLALIAYLCLVAAWAYIANRGLRLKAISKIIMAVPEQDRAALIAKEYNTTPRKGLSAEQWIRSGKHMLLFLAFVAFVVAATVVVVTALLTPKRSPQVSGPALTTGDQSPAVTGDGNKIIYGTSPPAEKKEKPKQ